MPVIFTAGSLEGTGEGRAFPRLAGPSYYLYGVQPQIRQCMQICATDSNVAGDHFFKKIKSMENVADTSFDTA